MLKLECEKKLRFMQTVATWKNAPEFCLFAGVILKRNEKRSKNLGSAQQPAGTFLRPEFLKIMSFHF